MTGEKYLVFDAETTGLDVFNDRIVQWFMATADHEGNLIDSYEWFIDPGVPIPEEASDVHGLTAEILKEKGALTPKDALIKIRDIFLRHRNLTLVAFNMNFDLSILHAEFRRHKVADEFGTWAKRKAKLIDGLVIDRHHDKYRKGRRNLETQAKHYGVPFNPDEAHDAAYDVETTARVTVRILEKFGFPTTGEQIKWYAEWAESLESYLRRTDPNAEVDRDWPLRVEGE